MRRSPVRGDNLPAGVEPAVMNWASALVPSEARTSRTAKHARYIVLIMNNLLTIRVRGP